MKRKGTGLFIALIWLLCSLAACQQADPGTLPVLTGIAGEILPSGTETAAPETPAAAETEEAPETPAAAATEETAVFQGETERLSSSSSSEADKTSRPAAAARGTRARPSRTRAAEEVTSPAKASTEARPEGPDYTREENWAYLEQGEDKPVDVFFVAPTVIDDGVYFRIEDGNQRKQMRISLNKHRGLYAEQGAFYSPYYRQMALEVYGWSGEEQQPWRDLAFRDVAAAFQAYLDLYNAGRPFILAGFSQGGELIIRLMIEFFNPATDGGRALMDRLVAVYAIGAGLPESTVAAYPWLRPADSAWDTGVIISFDCERPGLTGTVLLPAGSRSLSINPLSWSRDGAYADKSLNLGAYFPGADWEVPQLCGCYIEPERGALVVPDINPDLFPTDADVLPPGNLHEYDYQFFYRNIQDNVRQRVEAFFWP